MKAKLTYLSLETIFYWTNILGMICGAFLILFSIFKVEACGDATYILLIGWIIYEINNRESKKYKTNLSEEKD